MSPAPSSPPATEALVLGMSLYRLPEKIVESVEYPAVDRVHAHVAWFEGSRLCAGTVPVGHPYHIGVEVAVLEEYRKRHPIGSVLPYSATSGEVREKCPERANGAPSGAVQTATIAGWFLVLNLGKDAEVPFLSRFLVGRRTTADGVVRGVHIKAERGSDFWPLNTRSTMVAQIVEAGRDLIWRNEAGAPVEYTATRGGYWQALDSGIRAPLPEDARGA